MIDNQLTAEPTSTADLINGRQSNKAADHPPLFPEGESEDFRRRWQDIQVRFVDEPRESVEHADQLVASVIQRLATQFAEERSRMEHEWSQGQDVSTEDLRQALRRYRSFFDRLLAV